MAASAVIQRIFADSDALVIGIILAILAFVGWIIAIVKATAGKSWEGVIVNKHRKENYTTDENNLRTYTVRYYLDVQMEDGTVKKKQVDNSTFYEYLNINDRVRFHPKLNSYYEKYDKSGDQYLICPVCYQKNTPANDCCERCHAPMLK